MKKHLFIRVIISFTCLSPFLALIAQNDTHKDPYFWDVNDASPGPSKTPSKVNEPQQEIKVDQGDPLFFQIEDNAKKSVKETNGSRLIQTNGPQEEKTHQQEDFQNNIEPEIPYPVPGEKGNQSGPSNTQAVPLIRQHGQPDKAPAHENLIRIIEATNTSSVQGGKVSSSKDKTGQAPDQIQIQEVEGTPPEEQEEIPEEILIRFTNIHAVEFVNFISRLSRKNFIFKEQELQFNISIVSDEPTTIDHVMTAFLQELRVNGMSLMEYGNNVIIHKNPNVRGLSSVTPEGTPLPKDQEIVTKLFRLNTLNPKRAAEIVQSVLSKDAQVTTSDDTGHVIVTDLIANVEEVSKLLKNLDAPQGGLSIGQYMVRTAYIETLVQLTEKIMKPIVQDQHFVLVPHTSAGSIFIVSSPFLVDKTLSVLQRLDQTEGITTRALEDEKRKGKWELGPDGKWKFRPDAAVTPGEKPKGRWMIDENGNWHFVPEGAETEGFRVPTEGLGPKGDWSIDRGGELLFELAPGGAISPDRLSRKQTLTPELPVGHIERIKFHIYKLKYRKGDQIVEALQKIGEAMQATPDYNEDLVTSINSIQWIEASNSLVFTGTQSSIGKIEQLIDEIDTPLRQVYIETLILETTVDDSLTYGVQFITKSGGGQVATAQGNLAGASTLPTAARTVGIGNTPDATSLVQTEGFNLGIIGEVLTKNGTQFGSISALITAIHTDTRNDIILTPKILVEDNTPAEIFVGINTSFQTSSIANEEGSIITSNVEFRDVGTTLKVTPQIGSNDIITMTIEQEVSRVVPTPADEQPLQQQNVGPTTTKHKTTTKVHMPDKHFLILSGMIDDEILQDRTQLPCLGGIPILGGLFSTKTKVKQKRNLMVFLRPQIIDTEEEMQDVTRRQQNIWKHYRFMKDSWKYETEEGLDFLNIISTDCENVCN